MKAIVYIITISLITCIAGYANAASINVSADVPQASDITMALSRVNTQGTTTTADDVWDVAPGGAIDFGTLSMDEDLGVFVSDYYFVAEVGADGAGPWRIDHKVTTVPSNPGRGTDLGDNIVVTMYHQKAVGTPEELRSTTIGSAQATASFGSSADVPADYNIAGGWLRVYYGIATGEEGTPGTPITVTETEGTYSGEITITLTAL